MGTTNSTKHELNSFLKEGYDNSGVQEWICTTTGNEERKKGLPVYNDVFTLSSVSGYQGSADINIQLLNWYDGVKKSGADIKSSPGIFNNVSFDDDKEYIVYGHPDKWVYDYQQDYNNCGVDSCLNILSMAGKKDIIEANEAFNSYYSNPIITEKKQVVWDAGSGGWTTKIVQTETYPKAPVETEDSFLLWAVQNSPNDSEWYETIYDNKVPLEDLPTLGHEINDYVIHSKNYEEYKTIADLQASPLELGGTNYVHRDNILNYWGVESSTKTLRIKTIQYVDDKAVVEPPEYTDNGDGTWTRVTITKKQDSLGKETTTTTLTELLEAGAEEDKATWKVLSSTEKVVVEYKTNDDYYTFLSELVNRVKVGQGVILSGFANTFKGGHGGPHAISLVGVVQGAVLTKKITTTSMVNGEQDGEPKTENIYGTGTLGVYVVDTGGFLTDGLTTQCAQFIDCTALYDFLTDAIYDEGGIPVDTTINYTNDEIRSWADNLNAIGNDRKNILYGNESQNYLWGKKGNDILDGAGGDDYLYGDQNNDTLYGGTGNDVLNGGSGNDTYIFCGSDYMEKYGSTSIENATGSHDYIIDSSGKNILQFDNSKGHIINSISGESLGTFSATVTPIEDLKCQNHNGDLVINYTIKNQVEYYTGGETISYNNNSITVKDYFKKQLYSSIQYIRESSNTQELTKEYNFVQEILSRGHIDYFAYANKNNKITGTKFMDSIVGGNRNDSLVGGTGNDIINGGASNDTIKGGTGNDVIYGSHGNDKIYGDSGDDIIKYQAAAKDGETDFAGGAYGGHDTIYSGSGRDIIELYDYTRNDITFTKAKNDLVISYNKETASSITIANYFAKKGKTSIYELRLSDSNGKADIIGLRSDYKDILAETQKVTGNNGYDYIKGTNGNDSLVGGIGHDTLYGGNGNDTLNGGYGSDKLYGQAGNNTYIFDAKALGEDTIYVSGNGKTTLDFSGSGIDFTSKGCDDAIVGYNDYSFTKSKNNLIINYSTLSNYADSDNAKITISNFFTAKGDFEILNDNGTTLNLKTGATIYMNGDDEKKNRITGSIYNDSIVGYEFNDTLNGGKGNDTIIGGKGNDSITGGTGNNIIEYKQGDGMDTITLSKGENLDINLTGFTFDSSANATTRIFDYEIVKSNLVISYIDALGKKSKILTLKGFGTKDITTASGSVELYNNGVLIKDLREGDYLDDYINFTPKKYSYTGKWQSEYIDTRALNAETPTKDRGAKVYAKAGNDTIIGSDFNDTIDGGDGNDIIYGSYGKNTINGGKGSDTYHVFQDTTNANLRENSTIKDTGKATDGTDLAKIYCDNITTDMTFDADSTKEQGYIWFNVKSNKSYTTTFNVKDAKGNTAVITGVEEIVINERSTSKEYNYNYASVVESVANWLSSNNYKDTAQVMKGDDPNDQRALLEIFATGFETGTP